MHQLGNPARDPRWRRQCHASNQAVVPPDGQNRRTGVPWTL